MTEKYQPIPHRLKNMAVGGHVAGAEDIDAGNGKTQQDINADTYRKAETYSKEQLNNMITTPEQEYLSVTATAETTDVDDIATLIATKYPDGKESADTVYRVGCWDGEQYNTNTYAEYVWDGTQYILAGVKNPGIDDEPTVGSSNLVESSGISSSIQNEKLKWNEIIGTKNNLFVGIILENGSYRADLGYSMLIPVSEGDTVVITSNNSYGAIYAFLTKPFDLVDGTSRTQIDAGDTGTITIPSGCNLLYVLAKFYYTQTGNYHDYSPVSIFINGNDAYLNIIDNKHIIYGNYFLYNGTSGGTFAQVLSAIPVILRKELALVLWRDTQNNVHIHQFISLRPTDENWNNESLWYEVINDYTMKATINRVLKGVKVTPLYFDGGENSYIDLAEDIVLSGDGDSIEMEVTCGSYDENPNGYGLARTKTNTAGIAIGASYDNLRVRADDKDWLLLDYDLHINKLRYTFKVSYESGNTLFYVDGELVSTYEGQKTITISSLGNAGDYGNWVGIIHGMKVNNEEYDFSECVLKGNFSSFTTPDMMVEKAASTLVVHKRYSDNFYISYPIIHSELAFAENVYPSFYDCWGLKQPKLSYYDGKQMRTILTLFRTGESETAIELRSGISSSYVYVSGNTHGFENVTTENGVRKLSIIIDNSVLSETSSFSLRKASNVNMLQYTKIYQAYTNESPVADVMKNWIFDANSEDIIIKSSIKFLRSLSIRRVMQGMFCVYRHVEGESGTKYLTNAGMKSYEPFVHYELEDGWEEDPDNDPIEETDNECSEILEYGEVGLGFSMRITDDNRSADGGMFVHTNNLNYNKIYFANNSGIKTVSVDEEYHATQIWRIQ